MTGRDTPAKPSCYSWTLAGSLLGVLFLAIVFFFRGTLLYLTGIWGRFESGEYGHGYLVLAISAYMIIQNRKVLALYMPCPDYRASVPVLLFSLLWMAGAVADVQVVQAIALLFLIMSTIWFVLGRKIGRRLLFPVLFMIFAVPVWFPLAGVLQDITAEVVFVLVRLVNIPAFLQENKITLPSGVLSVEETCGGMRYFLAALMLSALYGYINYRSVAARVIVILVAALSGMLANILRVFIVVYLGYATEMQHPLIYDHIMLGWYLFAALVGILLFADFRLHPRCSAQMPASTAVEKDSEVMSGFSSMSLWRATLVAVVAIAMLAAGPAIVIEASNQRAASSADNTLVLPAGMHGWIGPEEIDDDWMPEYDGAIEKKQFYSKAGRSIILYVGYYPVQNQGRELIAVTNRINNVDIWRSGYTRARPVSVGDRRVLEEVLVNRKGRRRLVWYWYNVAGTSTTNKYAAKALQVAGVLTGRMDSYVVAVAADINSNKAEAQEILLDFFMSMRESLEKAWVKPESNIGDSG